MKRAIFSEVVLEACDNSAVGLHDFDSLVVLYRPKIFRLILASLRDRDAAETLTQECFIKAYNARAKFRGESSVKTWLMQIAVNLVRDHVSNARLKFWKRVRRSDVDVRRAEGWLVDRQSSPEALASAKQQVEAVWDAASALPERQRTVFLLRFVEDLDLLEIAAVTGMKEGTVKAHLFRALQSVRTRLEGKK